MAVYDLEEREQIEDLKAWWTRYGGTVTVALVLGCLVVAGIQGWRWYTAKRAESASVLYGAVGDASRAKDAAKA
jgi:predicted negative regulator of RcsB-dependent stress response